MSAVQEPAPHDGGRAAETDGTRALRYELSRRDRLYAARRRLLDAGFRATVTGQVPGSQTLMVLQGPPSTRDGRHRVARIVRGTGPDRAPRLTAPGAAPAPPPAGHVRHGIAVQGQERPIVRVGRGAEQRLRVQVFVLLGPPGTGETHLTTGLGIAAAHHGHRALFATATEWVTRLTEAHRAGRLPR